MGLVRLEYFTMKPKNEGAPRSIEKAPHLQHPFHNLLQPSVRGLGDHETRPGLVASSSDEPSLGGEA